MFNRKSSYALNKKDPNAIVYMDANEAIIRLTREDFASEKEFLKWKALSDEDYHASEKEAHVYANHTLALDELSEEAASIPAVDVCMEQAHDRAEAIHRSVRKVTQIRKHLTDTQFRKAKYTKQAEDIRESVRVLKEKLTEVLENRSERNRWISQFTQFSTLETLDRRALIHMVQSIRVRGKKELDITFTHEDEYKKALQLLALAAQQKDYEQRKVG